MLIWRREKSNMGKTRSTNKQTNEQKLMTAERENFISQGKVLNFLSNKI